MQSWKVGKNGGYPRHSKPACRESLPVAIAAAVLPNGWLLQSATALWRSAASTICWARTRFDSSKNWIRPHPRERLVCCHRLAWQRGPASPRCEDWPPADTHRVSLRPSVPPTPASPKADPPPHPEVRSASPPPPREPPRPVAREYDLGRSARQAQAPSPSHQPSLLLHPWLVLVLTSEASLLPLVPTSKHKTEYKCAKNRLRYLDYHHRVSWRVAHA